MSGVDSRDYVSWGSFELKRAIRLSLSASRPTNIQLCEVAHRTVKFPREYVSATANDADKAIAQLNQVPIFLSRMEHFRKFVADYMDVSWPVEKNANEPRHHRLKEVAEDVIKAQASAGWAILKTDFHNIRKKSMDEVYDAITRCCREKVKPWRAPLKCGRNLQGYRYHLLLVHLPRRTDRRRSIILRRAKMLPLLKMSCLRWWKVMTSTKCFPLSRLIPPMHCVLLHRLLPRHLI